MTAATEEYVIDYMLDAILDIHDELKEAGALHGLLNTSRSELFVDCIIGSMSVARRDMSEDGEYQAAAGGGGGGADGGRKGRRAAKYTAPANRGPELEVTYVGR